MAENANTARLLHIRFAGRSTGIALTDLDVGQSPSDSEVKQATARFLDVSVDKFRHYVVDRHETGNLRCARKRSSVKSYIPYPTA